MAISIGCRELGIDCGFMIEGETGEIALDSLVEHLLAEHAEDWFEMEEVYQFACSILREKAA